MVYVAFICTCLLSRLLIFFFTNNSTWTYYFNSLIWVLLPFAYNIAAIQYKSGPRWNAKCSPVNISVYTIFCVIWPCSDHSLCILCVLNPLLMISFELSFFASVTSCLNHLATMKASASHDHFSIPAGCFYHGTLHKTMHPLIYLSAEIQWTMCCMNPNLFARQT